jgi:hypothetical protein
MRRLIAIILLVFATSALADTRWTPNKVVGLRFYIVDPVRVESYWCTKDGFVAVEIGTHKAITPPLWYWKIRDGRLQFSDSDSIKEDLHSSRCAMARSPYADDPVRSHLSDTALNTQRPNQSLEPTAGRREVHV